MREGSFPLPAMVRYRYLLKSTTLFRAHGSNVGPILSEVETAKDHNGAKLQGKKLNRVDVVLGIVEAPGWSSR